jgi:hypothetical protein
MSENVSSAPAAPPDPNAERRARAELRQAVWEASQWMSSVQLVEFVVGVVAEIESDEP